MSPCIASGNLVVCTPTSIDVRAVIRCPNCKTDRRCWGFDAIWYGVTWTCCRCGDSWADGWLMPRPALRGWRAKAATEAKERWKSSVRFLGPEHRAWMREQFSDAVEAGA